MVIPISLTLILGLGACTGEGDWCVSHPAKIALESTLVKKKRHSLVINAEHLSNLGDGELRRKGDRGFEVIMLQYEYKVGGR